MLRDRGQAMGELIAEMRELQAVLGKANGAPANLAAPFGSALDALEDATRCYLENVAEDPDLGSAVGVDYMMLAGNVVCAWLMARAALAAQRQLDEGDDDAFYAHKLATAQFFADRILPRSLAQRDMVKAGSASVMAIDADAF